MSNSLLEEGCNCPVVWRNPLGLDEWRALWRLSEEAYYESRIKGFLRRQRAAFARKWPPVIVKKDPPPRPCPRPPDYYEPRLLSVPTYPLFRNERHPAYNWWHGQTLYCLFCKARIILEEADEEITTHWVKTGISTTVKLHCFRCYHLLVLRVDWGTCMIKGPSDYQIEKRKDWPVLSRELLNAEWL